MPAPLPQWLQDAFVAAYLNGEHSTTIARRFGRSVDAVLKAVRRQGVPVRTAGAGHRKYQLDESYFREIRDERRAYFLGLIAADGCVCEGRRLYLQLTGKDDAKLLYALRAALKTTLPVERIDPPEGETKNEKTAWRISIHSQRIVSDLARHGITARKSLTYAPWISTDGELQRHFWRGMFDGDGYIFPTRKNPRGLEYWRLGLCGSKQTAFGFTEWVWSALGEPIRLAESTATKRLWIAHTGCLHIAHRVLHLLYDNSTVRLGRKYRMAKRCWKRLPIRRRRIDSYY